MYHLNEYQVQAAETRLESATTDYLFLGLAGEAGELLGLRAKAIRDGRKFDYDLNIKKELGDVLWFVAQLATDHGLTLEEIANANIHKLKDRQQRNQLQGSGDNR